MDFKTEKSLACDFCGHPIKSHVIPENKTILYICSNKGCSNGKEPEAAAFDTFPEWVVMRVGRKIWSE